MLNPEARLPLLDPLRGLAAFLVAWFHFTKNNPGLSEGSLLRASGGRAWLGVEIFFVISGFVIPLALSRSSYRLKDFGRFMARRVIRLDPPYLVAIAVTIVLGYLSAASPGYRGVPYHITLLQLLLHVGFVNVFFGYPWINAAFWTLAIEFQYYLLMGLVYPLLTSTSAVLRYAVMIAFATMAFVIPNDQFVFRYAFLFLFGILTFQRLRGLVSDREYVVAITVVFIGAVVTLGPGHAIVGVLTATLIATVNRTVPVLRFLGLISYPLYLLHNIVGGRVINLAARTEIGRSFPFLVIVGAFALSIAVAWLLHITVEVPARGWASKIKFPHARVQPIEAPSL